MIAMSKGQIKRFGWLAIGGGAAIGLVVVAMLMVGVDNQQLKTSTSEPSDSPATLGCECLCKAGTPDLELEDLCTHTYGRFKWRKKCTDYDYEFKTNSRELCEANNNHACRGYKENASNPWRGFLDDCEIIASPSPSPSPSPS